MRRAVVVVATIFAVAATAHAQTETRYSLTYERPASADCPSEAALRASVAAGLGYDPFAEDAATAIVVAIHAGAHAARGRIEMREADGRRLGAREIAAPSCAELTPALALAIAVAIDPLRAGAPRPPAAPAKPATATTTSTTSTATATATATAQRAAPPPAARPRFVDTIRLRMAVGVGASIDSAPAPAFGFSARVGGATDRWSLSLELRGDLPAGRETLGGHANASLMAVLAVACGHHRGLGLCALVGAGGQEVSGSGYLSARSFWVPWAALGGRLELALPVSRQLAVTLHVDLLAPVTRTQLQVGGERPFVVYRTAALSNTFGIALSTR